MSGAEQYASDMEYLRQQANQGTLTRDNRIWQKLDGKRNIAAVESFLSREIAPKLK